MFSGIAWRLGLISAKLAGKRSLVPWPVVWTEVTHSWEYTYPDPKMELVKEDGDFKCYRFGEHEYWVPARTLEAGLVSIWKAIFNPNQPHHSQFGAVKIEPGDVVIDAGACEGFFTRLALDCGANVITVEPWSKMAEALERTFAKEIAEGRVVVERAFLTDHEGMGKLSFDEVWPFGANGTDPAESQMAGEDVPETTIDRLIERSPWKRCDFIKMDIEGAEPSAVRGCANTFKVHRPKVTIAVYHRAADYRDVVAGLDVLAPQYRRVARGLMLLEAEPVWRPRMLHAWDPSRS